MQSTLTEQLLSGALAQLAQEKASEGLRIGRETRRMLDRIEAEHVETMRANGASWSEIADALGVTRGAAWQRFGRA